MELTHAQTNTPVQKSVSVVALGFNAMMLNKLQTLFQTARSDGGRAYLLSPQDGHDTDILLVNADNPAALVEKNQLTAHYPALAVVFASQGPLTPAPQHHLRGMVTAARLLAVLDNVSCGTQSTNTPVTESVHAAESQPVTVVAAIVTPVEQPASGKQGYRVLVVDDSLAIQKSLELKLAALAQVAQVDCADSGEIALEKATAFNYDLIFLDVMMPGIDGYETCSQLRKRTEYKKTPIIMVSGKTSPLDEVKGVMAGCTTYLTKPVQDEAFNKLSLRILAWLADRKPLVPA
jgi:CheY-like chemotaxis protein